MSDSSLSVPGTPSTPGTPDISVGSTTGSCLSSQSAISVVGGKFVPNCHSISKTITDNFMEPQDATGYTWKDVCQSTRDFYWHEFMKLYHWSSAEDAIIKHIVLYFSGNRIMSSSKFMGYI
nr:uncharacterized protein LOC108945677 [Nicotiana tomentosiformis]